MKMDASRYWDDVKETTDNFNRVEIGWLSNILHFVYQNQLTIIHEISLLQNTYL